MAFRASLIGDIMKLDEGDLERIALAVKSRRDQLNEVKKLQFGVGDRVTFVPSRGRYRGVRVTGPVLKVMRKNIRVRDEDSGVQWTVHPSFLESA